MRFIAAMTVAASVLAVPAVGFGQSSNEKPPKPVDNYDVLLQQYLEEARAVAAAAAGGSLWMASLSSDLRARRVNDLVTIRVVENVSGLGSADSNVDKKTSGSAGVGNLFGLETRMPAAINPSNLVGFTTSTNFQGGGSTSRSGALSAVLTARVQEVLPNGDLVVQGVREIEINGDRQILVLSGVVRPADIGAGNVVASTAVGQMRIRYFGRGLMKDSLTPGWLVRILNKIF